MHAAIYFPILRGKEGERIGVRHLSAGTQTRIRPMFDVSPYVPKENDAIERCLAEAAADFATDWGIGLPAFFDFSRYGPGERTSDGRHPCEHFFDCTRQLKMQAVPVGGPESFRGPGTRDLEAVATVARMDQRGAAVRLPYDALATPEQLNSLVRDIAGMLTVPAAMIDLFLDLEALDRLPPALQTVRAIVTIVDEALRALEGMRFRNLVVIGCSLPEKVPPVHNWSPLHVPRSELAAWKALSQRRPGTRLGFGDYAVTYAFESDPDGYVIAPARIRVSTETEYVLHRAPPAEYRQLCAHVAKTSEFDSSLLAWGAQEITKCGGWDGGPGAAREWIARDTNLHLERTRRIVEAELGRLGLNAGLEFAEPEPKPYFQGRFDL